MLMVNGHLNFGPFIDLWMCSSFVLGLLTVMQLSQSAHQNSRRHWGYPV